VAPPVAEPVIAGDDGLPISACGDELVSGGCQRANKRLLAAGSVRNPPPPLDFGLPQGLGGGRRSSFQRRDESRCRLALQIHAGRERAEEILPVVQASLPLPFVLKAAVPIAGGIDHVGLVRNIERRQARIWSYTGNSGFHPDLRVEHAVFVSEAVVVAKGDQRP